MFEFIPIRRIDPILRPSLVILLQKHILRPHWRKNHSTKSLSIRLLAPSPLPLFHFRGDIT